MTAIIHELKNRPLIGQTTIPHKVEQSYANVAKKETRTTNNENMENCTPLPKDIRKMGNSNVKPLTPLKSKPQPAILPQTNLDISMDSLSLNLSRDVDEFICPDTENKGSQPASEERKLEQRSKQVVYGYNTEGYKNYISQVPKSQRKKGMPQTPDKYQSCSKRSWDGQVRAWRRQLHQYDPLIVKELRFD